MEASALQHAGAAGLHGRSPLLRLQSDERLVALVRRGNQAAFEALVARYQSRLLAFCRHMLSSREDAEDVLQEVFAAAFNAMLADERAINVRPWLYRIARNRSLNHLRRTQAVGVDSMDIHLSEGGLTTADKVHKREEFRLLVADVQDLPETQRTALLLREIDALSYEQISEAMETTVPSVKSLLVRARVSLAEAAEARLLTCDEVRDELGEVAEGLRRTSAPVRRHLRTCDRCVTFRKQLRANNKALAAVFPVGPLLLLKKTLLAHLGTTAAASGGTAAAAGGGAAAAAPAAPRCRPARARWPRRRPPASPPPRSSPPAPSRPSTSPSTAPLARPPSPPPRRRPRPSPAQPAPPVAVRSAPQPVAPRPAATRAPRAAPPQGHRQAPTPTPTPAAKPTLVAAVTPLREQHEADTTTPTETSGSMEQTERRAAARRVRAAAGPADAGAAAAAALAAAHAGAEAAAHAHPRGPVVTPRRPPVAGAHADAAARSPAASALVRRAPALRAAQ